MGKRIESYKGYTFETRVGGVLTVIQDDQGKGNKRFLTCTCSICSEDKDLWPTGSIVSTPSRLAGGASPCGCTFNVKWSKDQIKVLIARYCVGTTYIAKTFPKKIKDSFEVVCSVCSLDEELWPAGSILTKIPALKKGSKPCGCCAYPKWSKSQTLIRCRRFSETLPLTVLGFVGEYCGNKTKLELKCTEETCGSVTSSVSVDKFLRGRGCPECGESRSANSSRINWVGRSCNSRKGGKLTILKDLKTKGILIHCSKCSEDPELFGKGEFVISKTSWSSKKVGCGCSPSFRYTKDQYMVRLNRRPLVAEGKVKVLGISGNFVGRDTYVTQRCLSYEHHQDWSTSNIGNCLSSRMSGCPECGLGLYGFYFARQEDLDNLYLLLFKNKNTEEVFVKIGRSFSVEDRITYYPDNYLIKIIGTFQGMHKNIYPFEKWLHRMFKEEHYTPFIPFGGSVNECFNTSVLDNPLLAEVFGCK